MRVRATIDLNEKAAKKLEKFIKNHQNEFVIKKFVLKTIPDAVILDDHPEFEFNGIVDSIEIEKKKFKKVFK